MRFGERGQSVITGASSIGLHSTHYATGDASVFSAYFSPGVDWFVARDVSIGIDLYASFRDSQGYGADGSLVETQRATFGGGPRIGFNLPLGSTFSWYPRLTLGYDDTTTDVSLVNGSSFSVGNGPIGTPHYHEHGLWVAGFAPLLVHPAPHVFVGVGPRFYHDLSRKRDGTTEQTLTTTLGGALVVGGWFGGASAFEETVRRPGAENAEPAPARFGDARHIVLTGDVVLAGAVTTYSGSDASSSGFTISPAIDYFIEDDISLGLEASYSQSTSDSFGADKTSVHYEVTTYGFGPQLGINVPLGGHFSWWPRAAIGFGSTTRAETTPGNARTSASANSFTDSGAWIHLRSPFLLHPAQHVFAGFGPTLYHDLSRSIEGRTANISATNLGADLLVGGWF